MKPSVVSESDVAGSLHLAAERHELFLLYQPKICARTGELAGVEALMRWESPDHGLLMPTHFIPIAERCGAIDGMTEWGLKAALEQWIAWRDQGFNTNIAFNISALTLRDVYFPDFLERLCQVEGVPCDQLCLEVTEGATQHVTRLLDTLTRFRIKGMGLSLDDFGTGYSSLQQLRQLPYTEIKIDRCFVEDVAEDPESRLIVKSIIDLAHGMGLIATAEGVETEATLRTLVELGCDRLQGYLMAEPLAGSRLVPWAMEELPKWRGVCGTAAAPAIEMAPKLYAAS